MPKFKQILDILNLMGKKEFIRNLGIVAHIDHGKTTLTDLLLAGTGLLSPKMVGSARVLDYLEEEQKRGITMKTANISLLYPTTYGSFIINLVDTPGHVDFTGKVTRALRSIDGAIVVVDAVEEVMAQTEIVIRQALEERVRPVLFINKVDRLIAELKLNEEQIQKKFTRIIDNFNDLLEIYGESQFKDKWKLNPAKGNVAFGTALHRWGFTLSIARQKKIKFSTIIDAYKNTEYQILHKNLPLHNAILDMAIKHIPNPLEAQKYRVEKIWKGNMGSAVGQAMTSCNDNGPAVMCITKVQADPNSGLVATGRLFSGTVKNGDEVYLVNAQKESVVQQVSIYMGAFREPVNQLAAGNIVALSGLELAKVGETIVAAEQCEDMVPFERIRYVSEPVVTVAIEPKNPKDLPGLLAAMDKLAMEDPNLDISINRETGEHLLSGMGELHLEVAVKLLTDYLNGMEIATSSPRVVYRETATREGVIATAKSPNKKNKFAAQAAPMEEDLARQIEQDENSTKNVGNILMVNEYKNVLVDCIGKAEQFREILDFIISGFTFACKAGPLCGEPLRGVKINLKGIQLSENPEHLDPVEIMRGVGKAIFGSFLTAKPMLFEPVYRTVVSSPTELAGECSKIISSRRGKISAFEQKGVSTVITGYIPVAETFGLSAELRSVTSGRAFWQSMFDHWEKVPEKLEAKTIKEVRKRKGLPSEVPKPERFLEENK
ncbi:MAG: elongation factor EF-2 [Candidatus Bathyarchaeota archaeon]|nr:MAG: elongation factor EF-2 [Candidatus Bathyarchaeota archaeon]